MVTEMVNAIVIQVIKEIYVKNVKLNTIMLSLKMKHSHNVQVYYIKKTGHYKSRCQFFTN